MSLYEQTIISLYGKEGKRWLEKLPYLINELVAAWQLSHLTPVDNLSYNYVLSGFQHKKPIILKLIFDKRIVDNEAKALKAFAGYGVISILAQDKHALLLERAVPGSSLKAHWPHNEDEATKIVCDCIKRLHHAPLPAKNEFPHLRDWFAVLYKEWPIPKIYLEEARKQLTILFQTRNEDKLLHGDLHHENILQHDHDWIIIDPKGVIGDKTYELAAFMQNPMPKLLEVKSLPFVLGKRINRCATLLNLHEKRVYQWCFVQAILSWVWNLEDGLEAHYFAHLTEIFFSLHKK
ncbi:aminoglycoside phosphotransferase family protein [Legionella cardiaca]|uniref:Aminoglycoside phosphotransferase family protein n=1 Tax=Legionella cardiaca TaxID=1071983 RepID=A0ABY8AXU6_9GAMM|nr:aminoglycoside phosphotransferase family protein [Legionella cardiaca]WED43927.1 aminoglycoside phosphotransferase family protein [Legionella cardiaca]